MKKADNRVSIHVHIDKDTHEAIKAMCVHYGDYAHIVREVLTSFVKSTKQESTLFKED